MPRIILVCVSLLLCGCHGSYVHVDAELNFNRSAPVTCIVVMDTHTDKDAATSAVRECSSAHRKAE